MENGHEGEIQVMEAPLDTPGHSRVLASENEDIKKEQLTKDKVVQMEVEAEPEKDEEIQVLEPPLGEDIQVFNNTFGTKLMAENDYLLQHENGTKRQYSGSSTESCESNTSTDTVDSVQSTVYTKHKLMSMLQSLEENEPLSQYQNFGTRPKKSVEEESEDYIWKIQSLFQKPTETNSMDLDLPSRNTPKDHSYKCLLCNIEFESNIGLLSHNKFHTGHTCTSCNTCFNSKKQLARHKRHKLDYCKDILNVKNFLANHIQNKSDLQCSQCAGKYTNSIDIQDHNRRAHGEAPVYSCCLCNKSIKAIHIGANFRWHFIQHIKTHMKQAKKSQFKECIEHAKNEKMNRTESIIQTAECLASIARVKLAKLVDLEETKATIKVPSNSSMNVPANKISSVAKIQCPLRDMLFLNKQKLDDHIHQRDPYCVQYNYLKTRLMLNQYRFKCATCLKSYNSLTELEEHQRKDHSGQSYYWCSECNMSFNKSLELLKHITDQHLVQPRSNTSQDKQVSKQSIQVVKVPTKLTPTSSKIQNMTEHNQVGTSKKTPLSNKEAHSLPLQMTPVSEIRARKREMDGMPRFAPTVVPAKGKCGNNQNKQAKDNKKNKRAHPYHPQNCRHVRFVPAQGEPAIRPWQLTGEDRSYQNNTAGHRLNQGPVQVWDHQHGQATGFFAVRDHVLPAPPMAPSFPPWNDMRGLSVWEYGHGDRRPHEEYNMHTFNPFQPGGGFRQ